MLDESRQLQLSETIPLGMQELPEHLRLRDEIDLQQETLLQLSTPSSDKQVISLEAIQETIGFRVGVASRDPEFLYENHQIPDTHTRVIIIVVPLDYDRMISAPSLQSATEILQSYATGGQAVIDLTRFLRSKGYEAMPHHPMGDKQEYHHLLLPPHATKAGLGERGRTGLFIDYIHGPTVRLAAVTTNASLPITTSEKRGITEFCHRCKYCVRFCPPNAIPDGTYMEQVTSGVEVDFKINAHRCFQYFSQHNGCGRCIVHCILAEPDEEDIARRMDRITNWYDKWVVSGKLDNMYERELDINLTQ